MYKRQVLFSSEAEMVVCRTTNGDLAFLEGHEPFLGLLSPCLLYTSDAADERSSVDLGGRRIIKKKT